MSCCSSLSFPIFLSPDTNATNFPFPEMAPRNDFFPAFPDDDRDASEVFPFFVSPR